MGITIHRQKFLVHFICFIFVKKPLRKVQTLNYAYYTQYYDFTGIQH